jgi:hypothetical protein
MKFLACQEIESLLFFARSKNLLSLFSARYGMRALSDERKSLCLFYSLNVAPLARANLYISLSCAEAQGGRSSRGNQRFAPNGIKVSLCFLLLRSNAVISDLRLVWGVNLLMRKSTYAQVERCARKHRRRRQSSPAGRDNEKELAENAALGTKHPSAQANYLDRNVVVF